MRMAHMHADACSKQQLSLQTMTLNFQAQWQVPDTLTDASNATKSEWNMCPSKLQYCLLTPSCGVCPLGECHPLHGAHRSFRVLAAAFTALDKWIPRDLSC
jgi:hypothetical protein